MSAGSQLRRRTPAPVSESLAKLGARIRQARAEAGLSQAQLGRPHFTRAYVSALELGKIRPAMKSLEFLATKLGKPAAYFLEDEAEARKRKERELALVRASQLIAEGSGNAAVETLERIEVDGLPFAERLSVKKVLGRAFIEAGDMTKAATTLTEALRGYESLSDAENSARVHGLLGGALAGLMNYAEAEAHLEIALRSTVDGVVRDPLFRVHVLHNLGVVRYERAAYGAALEHFERAAREGADVADPKWLASVYAAIGMSRREVGDYEGAISSLRKSEALFESIKNRSRVAEIRFQTARALRSLGNKTKANDMLAQAIDAAEDAGNEPLAVRIEAFRGWCVAEDGQRSEALAVLEPLLRRADATCNDRTRFVARFTYAKVLVVDEPARATNMLKEIAKDLEGRGAGPDLAQVYDELGKALDRQGLSEESVAYAQRAYATGLNAKKKGGI